MDAFGRIIAVLLAAILIFVYPLQYLAMNQEIVLDNHVHSETTEFTDEIMLQSYLTLEMYTNYLEQLNVTNQLYDIEFIHSKLIEGYDTGNIGIPPLEEKMLQTAGSSIGKKVLGESYIKNSFTLLATHIHTTACYAGHNHTASGCNYHSHSGNTSSGGSCYQSANYHSHSSSNGCYTSSSCGGTVSYYNTGNSGSYYCSTCKKNVTVYQYGRSCSKGCSYSGSTSIRACGHSSTNPSSTSTCTKSVSKLTCAISTSAPISYNLSCYQSTGYTCGYSNDYNPICATIVTSITATNATQTVIKGIGIVTTALATYLDGHTATVNCTSNYNGIVGTQTVTLTYSGGKTCSITVITKPNINICTAGLGHPDYSGELTRCPICGEIAGISFTNTSVPYTGSQQGINANSSTGATTVVYYNNSIIKPIAVGNYAVKIYVKINGTEWIAKTTTFTIYRVLSSISPNMFTLTIYKGATFPITSLQLNYNNATNETITSGWVITGFNTNNIGTQNVTISYGGVSTVSIITVQRNIITCVNGHTYELDDYDTDHGCQVCKLMVKSIDVAPQYITVERGNNLDIRVTATYLDGYSEIIITGWTSNFISSQLGNQLVTVTYEGKSAFVSVTVVENIICPICGTVYHPSVDGTDLGCPICSIAVVSISATPTTQIVPIGETISFVVLATYLDGHSEEITDWTSNFNAHKVGTQNVTIFYNTITTSVTVIVKSVTETTCSLCGTVYNPIEYPNGCPFCAKTVERIEARLRNGGTQVQYGSELNLAVVLIFIDGHREIAYNGWSVGGYQAEILGTQTLTVTYNEHQTTLTIEIVNSLSKTVCINGHVYYLNADESDPGCPYCNSGSTTEFSKDYVECIYTDTILEKLYANGIYYFEVGDYITVTITPKTITFLDKLQSMFLKIEKKEAKYSYGGLIVNG